MSDVYQEEQKETILINGIRLPLMPSDISAFSDNAILSEVYIKPHFFKRFFKKL